MTREQIIGFLKNGEFSVNCEKFVFVIFDQWPEEVQEVAREIGRENFEYCAGKNDWRNTAIDSINEFYNVCIYRLRADYEDKPKEPEREYLEIEIIHNNGREIFSVVDGPWAANAASYVGFLGYAKTLDQKDNFQQHFTPEMKYVVIRKEAK